MQAKVFETPAIAEDVLREASKFGGKVTDAVKESVGAMKDGVRTAGEHYQRGRDAAEDLLDDTKRSIKRNPLQSVAIGFAAGFLFGGLIFGSAAMRRRW